MLALPFLMILFVIVETGVVFLGEMTLDNAIAKVGRQVRTGEVAQAALSETAFRGKICDEVSTLFDCAKLKIDLRTYNSYADLPNGPPLTGSGDSKTLDTGGFRFEPGEPDKIMALQVYYEWPIYGDMLRGYFSSLQSEAYLVGSTFAFRTEPYS